MLIKLLNLWLDLIKIMMDLLIKESFIKAVKETKSIGSSTIAIT